MHINYLLLFWGFVFSFFLPGYLIIQNFYAYLPTYKKIPLIGVTSIIVSTYLVYFVFIVFGFSRVVLGFLIALLSLIFILYALKQKFIFKKRSLPKRALFISAFIYILFFAALAPGIMTFFNGYWVMSAVNWQDTAMHLGIMESIREGNFLPQAPYFSGQPLTYYYFSDLHTAVVSFFADKPSWEVLVWDNPFFAALFSLSIYGLTMSVTRSRSASLFAALISVFAGSFMFLYFISDWADRGFLFSTLPELLRDKGYTMDFDTVITMVPMADYFLQNRPMMVGLPTVVCVMILVLEKKHWPKALFLASALSAFVFKFQLFASVVGFGIIGLSILTNLRHRNKKVILKALGLLAIPVIIVVIWLLVSRVGSLSFIEVMKSTLRFGPWNKDASPGWFLLFYPANLGMSFILGSFLGLFSLRKNQNKKLRFLFIFSLYCLLLPVIVVFTAYEWDMFKFFYFSQIGFIVLSALGLSFLWKYKWGKVFALLLLFIISATSILTLLWSGLNKFQAYTNDQYLAGMWIKNNTPQTSVFLTPPTVHSPVTQIAGRLRVLSYTTWPYSHGYNVGQDNVFVRLEDIEKVYENPDTWSAKNVFYKYKVDYIYWDENIEKDYPGIYLKLIEAKYNLIYQRGGVAIFTPPDVF